MSDRIYLTTTLPYVNAAPHLGFALEIVHADIFARYKRLTGHEVFFNTGTDEHGQKIFEAAKKEGKDTQKYVDEYAAKFGLLKEKLNLSYDNFIRTTDPRHVAAAEVFWKRCKNAGDIYKKLYKVKYCVGCELEKTESELENGKCPLHPDKKLDIREEENYFFRFSKYRDTILAIYRKDRRFVVPSSRLNEIRAFVERGLEDFSISRLKEKMPWGVPVPDDKDHIMYVWFDALVNYLSAIGWPDKKYEKWWPVIQFAGKDNLRQQSAMWQAMLMSAGIEPSKQIVIHGFITSGGQKMSKSLGNVVDPFTLVDDYGTDAVRYYLARHTHPFEDSDFTTERFREVYNAHLANGIGNQVARVMKLAEMYLDFPVVVSDEGLEPSLCEKLDQYAVHEATDLVFEHIQKGDSYVQTHEPHKNIKSDDSALQKKAKTDIEKMVRHIYKIAEHLEPFMPETSKTIKKAVKENKKPDTLFPRKDS